jgi:hypothetical protein
MLTEGKHLAVSYCVIQRYSVRCFTEPALSAVEGFNMTTRIVDFVAIATA